MRLEQVDDADAGGEIGAGDLDDRHDLRKHASVVVGHAVEAAAEHHAARFLDARHFALAMDPRGERARELALSPALAPIGVVTAHELVDLGEAV